MAPVNIQHHIAKIYTARLDDCWAAATAMVMHRHSIAGTDHVKALAQAANIPLSAGTLPDTSVALLAGAVHLGFHDFQSKEITLAVLERLLKRGPVVAFGYFNYPGRQPANKHAVAIYSLIGDGSARRTRVNLIDPSATVNPFHDDWEHFMQSVADITYVLSY
jgi:hypothetical protein